LSVAISALLSVLVHPRGELHVVVENPEESEEKVPDPEVMKYRVGIEGARNKSVFSLNDTFLLPDFMPA
jgi:hypothetical protein